MKSTLFAALLLVAAASFPAHGAAKAKLPLVIVSNGTETSAFAPSGWEGNAKAIKMVEKCPIRPHAGKASIEFSYKAPSGWGGVIWQNPANNWGSQAGGLNLTGATKLTFWARGAKGGEHVTFLFGVLRRNVKFHDSASGSLDAVLTNSWQPYTIPLAGKNLSDILTGFGWTVSSVGQPVAFFLDDVRYR